MAQVIPGRYLLGSASCVHFMCKPIARALWIACLLLLHGNYGIYRQPSFLFVCKSEIVQSYIL